MATKSPPTKYKRGHWRNAFEFMLSAMGYSIGVGNLWRFPYIALRNGGGGFLIPYILLAAIFGVPLFFLESALGQYFQRSPMGAFDICPLFKGIGITMCLISMACTIYYMTILAWTLFFLYHSFSTTLPWTTCDNSWNTNSCVPFAMGGRNTTFNSTNLDIPKPTLPTEEFWRYETLGQSSGVHELGSIQPHLALTLFITWTSIFLGIFKGIDSSRIAVYFTATAPFLLLLVLGGWTASLPGAVDGILVYITPQWDKMANYQVWLEAFIQVFYSTGPAWGGILTLSSYNPFHHNCARDSVIVAFTDVATGIFCGFVIFSGLGHMAHEVGVPVLDVVTSGPGLSFVAYPQVVSTMPIPQLWAAIFFILVFLLGIDTSFGAVKTLTSSLFDMYPERLGRHKELTSLVVCLGSYLLGLIYVTQGGIYWFQLTDWYVAFFALMVVGLLECVVVAHIYGTDRFVSNVKEMIQVNRWFMAFVKYSLKFHAPILIAIVLVFTVATFRSPTYGDYVYPGWTNTWGWILGISQTLPIPAGMLYYLLRADGTLKQRFKQTTTPVISRRGEKLCDSRDVCLETMLPAQDTIKPPLNMET